MKRFLKSVMRSFLLAVICFSSGFLLNLCIYESKVKDRNTFIENCIKTGKTEELCIDNFHGFPRREERF